MTFRARTGIGVSRFAHGRGGTAFRSLSVFRAATAATQNTTSRHCWQSVATGTRGRVSTAALKQARRRLGLQRSSIFASVSNTLPHVSATTFSKRTMVAISRAIEDEAATRADRPTLVGSFQAPRFWRQSSDRWSNLIDRRGCAVAIAAFRQSGKHGAVFEVARSAGNADSSGVGDRL